GRELRGWAYELIGVRNENKHLVANDHPSDYAWRALDTMGRLCEPIDDATAKEIRALRSAVDLSEYGQAGGGLVATSPITAAELSVEPGLSETDTSPTVSVERDLSEALQVVGPDFSGADLRKMNFAGANLAGADFTDADLTDADLHEAD